MPEYHITEIQYLTMTGDLLWVGEPISDFYLYEIGVTFIRNETQIQYRVERMAIKNNSQIVNVSPVLEDVNMIYPHL